MEITRRSRLLLRLQTWAFAVLFIGIIGMLAWLSTQYVYQADWTSGSRNTVTDDTRQLLSNLPDSITLTAFAREDELLRKQIQALVARYQRFKPDITLEFINPDTAPERVRAQNISVDGEIVVSYLGRSENIQQLNEQQLTNTLLRLSRQEDRWVVFLTGHGEQDPHGEANHDLGLFGKELERKGLKVQRINLAENTIPENTHLLIIAGPRVTLLPGEVEQLHDYVAQGGNLLWLAEPGKPAGLERLAEQVGVTFLPGVVVDATTQMFGIENPSFVVVTAYPNHEVARDLGMVTVFPEASALETSPGDAWQVTPLLTTAPRSWTEIDALAGEIQFDADSDERPGPLDIGVVITGTPAADDEQEDAPRKQRIAIIGDGDFLSNAYLGNGGNLNLGLNLVHWLSHDDAFINIQVKTAPDTTLELGRMEQAVIGLGSLIGLPLLLLLTGLVIWLRRRRR
ncbi:MAG: GldG family protein [Gammaproteobacteria bacterium]|nr:MAG: GldG family protein [Gammaproteobacteria bacterium]